MHAGRDSGAAKASSLRSGTTKVADKKGEGVGGRADEGIRKSKDYETQKEVPKSMSPGTINPFEYSKSEIIVFNENDTESIHSVEGM